MCSPTMVTFCADQSSAASIKEGKGGFLADFQKASEICTCTGDLWIPLWRSFIQLQPPAVWYTLNLKIELNQDHFLSLYKHCLRFDTS